MPSPAITQPNCETTSAKRSKQEAYQRELRASAEIGLQREGNHGRGQGNGEKRTQY
jgi:hypothetical protein